MYFFIFNTLNKQTQKLIIMISMKMLQLMYWLNAMQYTEVF